MRHTIPAKRRLPRAVLATTLLAVIGNVVASDADSDAATKPPVVKFDTIEVTPLNGGGESLDKIAAPVQTASADALRESNANDLTEFLNRKFAGVTFNEVAGNPLQPDVNFRGYTASPLLGTPQGLSVYMDGVRMNQPFGDVVSWDLIPRLAIASTTLIPGSNPVFGLNTLGGAMSLQTKTGAMSRGTTVQASYGSDARRAVEFEHGGVSESSGLEWYVAGSLFAEDGWRDASPSDIGQIFGKLGWRGLTGTVSYANDSLTGNGFQDVQLLKTDYDSFYTKPDVTENRSTFLNVTTRHSASGRASDTRAISTPAFTRSPRPGQCAPSATVNRPDIGARSVAARSVSATTAAGNRTSATRPPARTTATDSAIRRSSALSSVTVTTPPALLTRLAATTGASRPA